MPRRLIARWNEFSGVHASIIILLLAVALVIALVFAVSGFTKARGVESQLETERIGKQIADVATCFSSSRTRPRLVVILRGIQTELEPDPRQALGELISEYEKDTPTTQDCVDVAEGFGIDPSPYLRNPPTEAGS